MLGFSSARFAADAGHTGAAAKSPTSHRPSWHGPFSWQPWPSHGSIWFDDSPLLEWQLMAILHSYVHLPQGSTGYTKFQCAGEPNFEHWHWILWIWKSWWTKWQHDEALPTEWSTPHPAMERLIMLTYFQPHSEPRSKIEWYYVLYIMCGSLIIYSL